ncbi:hypothetical protein [Novosphingobium gossypii]|uniref:hypothetical protein n=1 Tax=Novosphingobium gossypii TaxID=1604774 RepID=UPI003D26390E
MFGVIVITQPIPASTPGMMAEALSAGEEQEKAKGSASKPNPALLRKLNEQSQGKAHP